MPLIEFPDVPPVAGVPDLNRLPLAIGVLTGITQATQAIQGLDYFNLLSDAVPQWIIADDEGHALVTPDSLVDLGYRGEQRVASYPVEQGSFAAYNKVAQPQELTLRLSCGGRNMSRDLFLAELQFLWASLTLVNVVTPDATYRSFNIDRLDYQRKSSSGLSLIVAEIHISEIRTSAQAAYSNTAQPSGSNPQSQGWVCTAANTPAPTNQKNGHCRKAMDTVQGALASAQQSVSQIESATLRRKSAKCVPVWLPSLETAVSGLVTWNCRVRLTCHADDPAGGRAIADAQRRARAATMRSGALSKIRQPVS